MTFRTFFTRALAVTVSVGVMVVTLSPAEAQTKVRFALDWQIQGPQAPFISAKVLGAFSGPGSRSPSTAARAPRRPSNRSPPAPTTSATAISTR